MLATAVEEGGYVKHLETREPRDGLRATDVTILRQWRARRAAPGAPLRSKSMAIHTQYVALVRLAARDWWRTRSVLVLAVVIALVFGLANFLAGLAVTEVAAQRVTFHAGLARPVLVLLFALVTVVALVRELDDRVLDMLLARPLARRTWYLARLSSQLLAACVLAAATALPLVTLVPPTALAAWTLSFACELAIVAALALALATSLGRVAPAMGVIGGFYALSRAMSSLVLMAMGLASEPAHPGARLVAAGVYGLALVLPDFSRYAPTGWLLGDVAGLRTELGFALGQTALYVGFLAALGLVDFERRDL